MATTLDRIYRLAAAARSKVKDRVAPAMAELPIIKARKIFDDYVKKFYYPAHGVDWRQRARITPRLLLVEYLVYQVDSVAERNTSNDLDVTRTSDYRKLYRYKSLFRRLAKALDAWGPDVDRQLDLGEEFVRLENAVTSRGQLTHDDIVKLAELRPTDVRMLHAMLEALLGQKADSPLREAMWPVEVLADIANDIEHYADDCRTGNYNTYASLIQLHGDRAEPELRELIAVYNRHFSERLEHLPPDQRDRLEQLSHRLIGDRLDTFPVLIAPHEPNAAESKARPQVSRTVIVAGTICVLAWIVAYASIIYRGFSDQTFGMPITALAANVSWEFIYGFLLDPFGDYIHTWSIPCFLVDLVILWQAWRYGANDFTSPLIRNNFRTILLLALAIAGPTVYYGFLDLNDPDGEYTGFGINLMMSILFIAMLDRRRSFCGQSIYAAVAKWLGTFSAYIATALTVTTTPDQPFPTSLKDFIRTSLTHKKYPLTPLINVMYGATFIIDAVYTKMLYSRLKAAGINPFRRF